MSAPVFHNVMDGALRLMDVAPDDLDAWLAAQAEAQASAIASRRWPPGTPPPPRRRCHTPLPLLKAAQ